MSNGKLQLTREKIAAAALAIADQEGFEAVSMRRVAQDLQAGTMSLYYYVKSKDDLIAAMDDALMGEAILPSLPGDWRRAIMKIAKRTLAVFIRHPWALVAMLSAPPGHNAMRHMEQCLEALAETSMTGKQKITPVSYTHLDVYKRQGLPYMNSHTRREARTFHLDGWPAQPAIDWSLSLIHI